MNQINYLSRSAHAEFLQGSGWMIMSCLASNLNDILIKLVGSDVPSFEITFFRFFFSTLILLPFIKYFKFELFKTQYLKIHVIRCFLLVVAMSTWCLGVSSVPLVFATTLSFTIPFFVLCFVKTLLKESVSPVRWFMTLCGFSGILIMYKTTNSNFHLYVVVLIFSSILFAFFDVINKIALIKKENIFSMLFYCSLGASLLSFVPATMVWVTPSLKHISLLFLLGFGENLIMYCLLKAYTSTLISTIQPIRYMEIIFSLIFGSLIFSEIPNLTTLIGAGVIICASFFNTLMQPHESACV